MKNQLTMFDLGEQPIRKSIINVASVPQRSPFRYPGGKTWLIPTVRRWLKQDNTIVKELIEPLRQGLHNLKIEPERYKKFNPENGWGSYDGLVKFVENYLNACYEYPDADVKVSR